VKKQKHHQTMASTRRSEDELKAMMPNKTIPPIGSATARPTWQSIQKCRALLAENAAAIPSRGQDIKLGHAAIVIGDSRYTTLSATNHVYIIPLAPVPPVYTAGMSYHAKEELKREYTQDDIDHYTYNAVEHIITQMYLDAVHEDYKTAFFTDELGYCCSFKQLDDYLDDKFNKKTSQELATNETAMKQPWSATTPIESLFRHLDACIRFDPTIPEETYVRNTVDIICINDGFDTAFKEWNEKRTTDKTWINLKEHFGNADKARYTIMALKTTKTSAPTTYPGSANSATTATVPTVDPIDRITKIVEKLCLLVTATAANGAASNTSTTTHTPSTPHPHVPRSANPEGGRNPTAEEAGVMSYCWSHGYCKRQTNKTDHTSASCDRPRIGHKTDATATNKMGGETRLCNSWPRAMRTQRE
jgi:hypothetical protein